MNEVKNNPDYIDLARYPERMVVQKANALQSLSETPLTLLEFKILDAYLARINSFNENERYVRFEKGKLEQLFGVERIKKSELSKRLDNLFRSITIYDENKKNGFTKIALFVKAECFQDDDDLWQINLACSAEAIEYFFDFDNLGYFHYRLQNIIHLKSRYSYIIYLYLEQNDFRKSIEISLVKLKKMLSCTAESYNKFKVFNDRVLKLCQKEIHEKTDIRYTYEPLKKGRKVFAIRFTIETLADFTSPQIITEPKQITFDSLENNSISFLAEACNNEFSEKEMDHIFQLICQVQFDPKEDINLSRYHLLAEKYSKLNLADEHGKANGKPIKNRFAYFSKIIIT